MKVEKNKMVAVDYKLTVDGQIADQSRPGQPLEFICGTGMLLPKFEAAIEGLEPGEKTSFTLAPKDGYGEFIPEAVVELPKEVFMVDGKLAEEILFVGSQVPMSDAQGHRMTGIVREIAENSVKMDFNHPMAGKTLDFEVEVVSVRDVTPEDLAAKGGCGCGCDHDDCHGGCGGHEHDGGCGCDHDDCHGGHGHHHDGECGCGHDHCEGNGHHHDGECGCGHDHCEGNGHHHDDGCGCGHDHCGR